MAEPRNNTLHFTANDRIRFKHNETINIHGIREP